MSWTVASIGTALGGALLRHEILGSAAPFVDDRYLVTRVLGRGTSGVVVEAWDSRLARALAIKLAPVSSASASMLDEARTLAQLRRPPNIVHVYEAARGRLTLDDGDVSVDFIVMELIRGTTLRSVTAAPGMTPARVVELYIGVLRGMVFLHEHGIVHGDIKPDNVLVDSSGAPILVDLGFGAVIAERGVGVRRGAIQGTAPYMAPEVRRGEIRRRSDVYAVAVSIWETLAGEPPFAAESPEANMFGNVRGQRGRERIPRTLIRMLQSCMRPNASRRPTSAAVLRALERSSLFVSGTFQRTLKVGAAASVVVAVVAASNGSLQNLWSSSEAPTAPDAYPLEDAGDDSTSDSSPATRDSPAHPRSALESAGTEVHEAYRRWYRHYFERDVEAHYAAYHFPLETFYGLSGGVSRERLEGLQRGVDLRYAAAMPVTRRCSYAAPVSPTHVFVLERSCSSREQVFRFLEYRRGPDGWKIHREADSARHRGWDVEQVLEYAQRWDPSLR